MLRNLQNYDFYKKQTVTIFCCVSSEIFVLDVVGVNCVCLLSGMRRRAVELVTEAVHLAATVRRQRQKSGNG
ncbi:MAG: hypothetical protein LBV29_07780, partial [Azoarcus sp.]|nr:hypothetical protein [Azoarcus sp.]